MVKTSTPAQEPGFDNAKLYVWVKGLESKINNLLREVDIIKNDFIKRANDLQKEFKTLNEEMVELHHEQEKMSQKTVLIIKELQQTAGIEEVRTMKKYLELWSPLNFVTQKDLDRAVENKMVGVQKLQVKETSIQTDETENKKGPRRKN